MSASPSVTMDTTYTMAPQPSFAYYPTDPTSQRQHTHYPSHPSEMQQPYYGQMHAFPQSQHHHHHPQQPQPQPQHGLPDQQQALYAAQPMMNMHQMATTNAFRGAINMTPIASPQPSQLKPTIIVQPGSSGLMPLDTRFVSADFYGFPSTPPLSASGSSISSSSSSPPSSTGAQHIPISENFLSFEKVEGVKEGCEGEVHTEILAHPEWTRSESPPMTPVFIHPPSLTASQTSDLLSANGSCPSLSPSPSPVSSNFDAQAHAALVSQSQSALPVEPAGAHFCDPRELTVESTVSGAAASDLPPLPTLACEEEDPKSALDNAAAVTLPVHENPSPTFAPGSTEDALNVLPTFDSFSDLDSEDEFVNRLVDFHPSGNAFFLGDKRQRVGNYGLEEDGFLSEHSLEEEDAVAHPGYASVEGSDLAGAHHCHGEQQVEEMGSKKQRSNSRKPIKRSSTSSESSDDGKKVQAVNTRANNSQASTGAQHSHHVERQVSEVSTASGAEAAPPVSVNRRGRKQSLTDDPSKTFVCTLCSRRFRRQEHLKRHYRSLHTQDKPFECNECGKKFSRSDNLAQHARTHGGQSVVMGVMDSGEAAAHASYDEHDPNALGAVLYEAANATAVKSATSESSEDGSSGTSRSSNKKRKRDENAA